MLACAMATIHWRRLLLSVSPLHALCGGLLRLATHLFHELAHFSDVTGRALLNPNLKALRGLFRMREELFVGPLLSSFGDSWLDPLPDTKNSPLVSKNRSS